MFHKTPSYLQTRVALSLASPEQKQASMNLPEVQNGMSSITVKNEDALAESPDENTARADTSLQLLRKQ